MDGYKDSPGVIPRAVSALFSLGKANLSVEYKFTLTMMEIYNETIRDLLAMDAGKDRDRAGLDIRHSADGSSVPGLTGQLCESDCQEIYLNFINTF